MLDAGAQPTLVASMLHAQNAMVTARDVYNMKQLSSQNTKVHMVVI